MDFNFTPNEDSKNPLEVYGRNLNNEVLAGKIDPVIGRDEEIRRLIEIISRKTKNNPVLIGEPGVGKTAIVEGLAQRIVVGDVPSNLKDKEIIELSLSSLIAGASYQGQFEQRLNSVIKKVKESDGKIILFIDEVHQLVGAGRNSGSGAMDAANIFKPMMARGEIKIIGATTLNEYRQYIEKDSALERRMQKILVKEPSKQEALTIMRGLKERWELFHKVKIHDSALIAAVNLSDRYISDRYLPDKAIDLIDEAAAKIKTEMHSMPVELDQINREIVHIETEKAALKSEKDDKSKKRLTEIEKLLTDLKQKQKTQNDEWNSQKESHDKLVSLKQQLEENNFKVQQLQMQGEFEKASKLLYVNIPDLQKQIDEQEKIVNNNLSMIRDSVTANEVAEVISKTTGIPLNKLIESEKDKLLHLDQDLKKRVKGQDEAIKLIANAVLRGRAGINDPNRPIGSFLFVGSTGVGKTELAKALASSLFDSEKAMVRFDMSEYMEKHSVSKLIGAPPGYVGYEQAGALTEAIRRKPYSVLLFDEIEKAHHDVLNLLLQVLDDGQLKDSQGRLINFKNTIIIMTTNIGAQEILANKPQQGIEELKKYLRPEFINRIDEVIVFNPLSEKVILEIVQKLFDDLSNRLKENDFNISFDKTLYPYVKSESYDQMYGARPIKRFIQKNIENVLAEKIVSNEIVKNKHYLISLNKDKKIIVNEQKPN